MNLPNFNATYRRLATKLAAQLSSRKDAAIEQKRARIASERRNAALALLLDDAKFHGISPLSLLGAEHEEEQGYKSAIGEDWPEDL
jgi:hypothetical protein